MGRYGAIGAQMNSGIQDKSTLTLFLFHVSPSRADGNKELSGRRLPQPNKKAPKTGLFCET